MVLERRNGKIDSDSQIIAWLSDIPGDFTAERPSSCSHSITSRPSRPPSPTRKRRRRPASSDSGGLPAYTSTDTHPNNALRSPPASSRSMSDDAGREPRTPRSKRQKVATANEDQDNNNGRGAIVGGDDGDIEGEEPTPRVRKAPSLAVSSLSHKAPSGTSSIASGTSSPTKQFEGIALKDDGIEKKTLQKGVSGVPDALNKLLDALEDVADGYGIISTADKAQFEAWAATDPTFPKLRDAMFDDNPHGLPSTPPLDAVLNIAAWARRCSESNAHEDTWNTYVHFPVLCLAAYETQLRPQLMNVDMCTHADVIREYHHLPIPSKRVDFVLHCRPASCAADDPERAASHAIDKVRGGRPLLSINHTDLQGLNDAPICTSIETKRQHRASDAAELQIGVWHAAQWKMLEQMAAPRLGGLDGCAFLPGVIIAGHDWFFVATTRKGEKTILWHDFLLGSSKSVIGLYKIIRGLQYLIRDGLTRYWPWFKRTILDLDLPSSSAD
ncbi:hypothetical protein SPI_03432 [Niveomyces insectorum RCEF 264]|uniref:PD-(D/E)XK nuclease-like domain-containing protein n=1 Tax=Niveomyces insectorum RCEF 264 TaxID=1081102 RepID=A0A167W2X0_9HYPO|nr:hypothetical protein SPI_03432 [Niveomyces insectorum RCEF 264]